MAEQDTEHEKKLQFAGLLQRNPKELRRSAALLVAKEVVGKEDCLKYPLFVIQIADEWQIDPIVVAEIERLDMIPVDKNTALNVLFQIALSPFTEPKDRVAALRLYADAQGWIKRNEKPDGSDNSGLIELGRMLGESYAKRVEQNGTL